MKNKYNVSYTPSSDNKGLLTLLWTPIESWDEGEPKYTEDEAKQVVKFISEYSVPIPENIGDWNKFRDELNKKIFELYGK